LAQQAIIEVRSVYCVWHIWDCTEKYQTSCQPICIKLAGSFVQLSSDSLTYVNVSVYICNFITRIHYITQRGDSTMHLVTHLILTTISAHKLLNL